MIEWTKVFDQVSNIQIKNVTDPLFKYSVYLFSLATLSAIFKAENWITICLFSIGGILILFGLFFFAYYSMKNPDYLRSENYHIKKQSIEILGDKDHLMNPNIKEIKFILSPYSKPIELGNQNNLEKTNE